MPLENPFVVLIGIVAIVFVASALVKIPENHRGVIVRLGKYAKTLNPGWHVRVPVIDLVTKVDLDASVPGWQGLSEAQVEATVRDLVTLGVPSRPAPPAGRPAAASSTAAGTASGTALAGWLLKAASDQTGVDLSRDPMAKDRIAKQAETALEELRATGACEINLPFLAADATGPKHFVLSLTRAQVQAFL